MWKVMELDSISGDWNEHGCFTTPEECKTQVASFGNGASNVYAFWDGVLPIDLTEQNLLIDEIFAVNNGRIERITIGLDLSSAQKASSMSSCPGRCFCVVTSGRRRCETYYCNINNICSWVPCGMNC